MERYEMANDEIYGGPGNRYVGAKYLMPQGEFDQVPDGYYGDNVPGFAEKREALLQKINSENNYNPPQIINYSKSLCEAMLFPEYAEGYKFPNTYNHPTTSIQINESFQVYTNAKGCAFVQVNMGQFLDSSMFKSGLATPGQGGANLLGSFNPGSNQNGTSTRANSNFFFCNDNSLDGRTPVVNNGTIIQGSNLLQIQTNKYQTVRPGPTVVKFEFSGQFVSVQGNIRAGVDTSPVVPDALGAAPVPGLEADVQYTTISALDKCRYRRTCPVTTPVRIVYVPDDDHSLIQRPPNDATAGIVYQKCFIFFSNCPPSAYIGDLRITQNIEATSSLDTRNEKPEVLSIFPPNYTGKHIYNFIIRNNFIVWTGDDKFLSAVYNKALIAYLSTGAAPGGHAGYGGGGAGHYNLPMGGLASGGVNLYNLNMLNQGRGERDAEAF
jgi:hypothetical protein